MKEEQANTLSLIYMILIYAALLVHFASLIGIT